MREHQNADDDVLGLLRTICFALPEATEQRAYAGTRWQVRSKSFAHVVLIENGWPPAYAKAAGADGPLTVLTFRADIAEHEALRVSGHPFFAPPWWRDMIGIELTKETDWQEVAELLTESYRLLAPQRLVTLLRERKI